MNGSWNHGVRGEQILPLINLDAQTIRVEAGPGTGKTFGLVRRVERILHPEGLGVAGRDVLVVAFNRVIARQLHDDISDRLNTFAHESEPVIRTIHALCMQVIGNDLRLLLPHEREAMIYDLLHEFPQLHEAYPRFDGADQALRDHEARNADHIELWQAARRWLTRHHASLVSDLPGLLLDHLQAGDFPDHSYLHVIVDEFQDLTPGEQELMFRLRRRGGQLVAIGDPRQSIYRFRGNDREGLATLNMHAAAFGDGDILDVPLNECQRCPDSIVRAANRLMSLANPLAMVSVSHATANLHVVVWPNPRAEAAGMAVRIVENLRANPTDRHLVMVTRRQFGYWLRDGIAAMEPNLRIELSFSEGLLETWAVREAFLLFCLLADPDRTTWRAWLSYENSQTGANFKAPDRNAGAYLHLLAAVRDQITADVIVALAAEPRNQRRGDGGMKIWDRARRFIELQGTFRGPIEDPAAFLASIFDPAQWVGPDYGDPETARLDMNLLLQKSSALLAEELEQRPDATSIQLLSAVARRLRYQIATREPFASEGHPDLQVATFWGAKGVTADHVYMLGVCREAIPGQRRDEYPGTDADYSDEQRRLFYVSITRSKRTLVISRARMAARGEARQLRLALQAEAGFRVNLEMSPFLRDIIGLLPDAVSGDNWRGCSG